MPFIVSAGTALKRLPQDEESRAIKRLLLAYLRIDPPLK